MFFYAFVFFVTALFSGFVGFTDLGGDSPFVAQVMFIAFSILFVMAFQKATGRQTQLQPVRKRVR